MSLPFCYYILLSCYSYDTISAYVQIHIKTHTHIHTNISLHVNTHSLQFWIKAFLFWYICLEHIESLTFLNINTHTFIYNLTYTQSYSYTYIYTHVHNMSTNKYMHIVYTYINLYTNIQILTITCCFFSFLDFHTMLSYIYFLSVCLYYLYYLSTLFVFNIIS